MIAGVAFHTGPSRAYKVLYQTSLTTFNESQQSILDALHRNTADRETLLHSIHQARLQLKAADFWLRYFEPNLYRLVNGPLPVEWENEVFEKFEPPYRRVGAGLSLLEKALTQHNGSQPVPDSLLLRSIAAIGGFQADSITRELDNYHHFFLANRLYLLNLAALYTTGFECPDTSVVIPELKTTLKNVRKIYAAFEESFPQTTLGPAYWDLYDSAVQFAERQPDSFSGFDRFGFTRDYVNRLFGLNQQLIRNYDVVTRNYNDFTLNNGGNSIFDKGLYSPQNAKGIFSLVEDDAFLKELKTAGRLLFYDPILSGNNERSCASCHKPDQYFTDTTVATAFAFGRQTRLTRNTPSLVNAGFQHLLMLDGKHISLQDQARAVMHNPVEMNNQEKEIVKKVMSCKTYRDVFRRALAYTPEEKQVSLSHIISAITYYYADFGNFSAPLDDAMNRKTAVSREVAEGFNLFMSKAQCGTCHFLPLFNGVKPPYIGTEFEVIGVPADKDFKRLSEDSGRYGINPAPETLHAFRTGTLRNIAFTKPYMHNGVFNSLEEVIDFYDAGGGAGKGLTIPNQTLASDSLHLSAGEKKALIAFLFSLNENITFDTLPARLPASSDRRLNQRQPGGIY